MIPADRFPGAAAVDAGLRLFAEDVRFGDWNVRFGALQPAHDADLGYRLGVARSGRTKEDM